MYTDKPPITRETCSFQNIIGQALMTVFGFHFLFISRFGFKSGICLLIAPVSVHCFSITSNDKTYQYVYGFVGITKTSPCNEDPLTPHFYIVKLGFTGVNIIFLFSL